MAIAGYGHNDLCALDGLRVLAEGTGGRMTSSDVAAARRQAAEDQLVALRGRAIAEYSIVEQSLCLLFSTLTGTDRDVAGVIFFNIHNARSIRKILRRLLEKKYGQQFVEFWKSFDVLLGQCGEVRNKIAHWGVQVEVGDGGFQRLALAAPNFWDRDSGTVPLTTERIEDFISRCVFISRLCNMFGAFLGSDMPAERKAPWQPVFSSALVFPPPPGHPLHG